MKELVAWVESVHPQARGGEWTPIERGGSDRSFWRGSGAAHGLVALSYGREKSENARYADCAEFLRARGIGVPRVLAHDAEKRFMLLEDAGSEDLWSHRGAAWPARRTLYIKALEQAVALHACDLGAAVDAGILQAPFDESLYVWEQEYFREHFLVAQEPAEMRAPMARQAAELARRPRVLLHRDFQSQNIMVGADGGVRLIDFQGMREGLAGYDVASLVFDPYVSMSPPERRELTREYAQMAGRTDLAAWDEELRACARQRLMQALGAYGFLGRVKGRAHFLQHIPVAAGRLAALCDEDAAWRPLAEKVREAALRQTP